MHRIVDALVPAVIVRGAPLVRYRLSERMARFHVPGVSVAVADRGECVWARGFGVKRAWADDPITAATIFEAGSISKPVTATATLRLVEQGRLSLDENVNAYLRSWKVPDNEFTTREKVTLRRILSHSAGTNVHGFPGYQTGEPLPSLQAILDGVSPANTKPVRVDFVPGTRSRYSGGGVTIEQLALSEVTGRPFPALLEELVLRPAGMTSSTFEQPLPVARRGNASTGHDTTGSPVVGGFHVYPEMAAAGLWSTPTDLLRWAIAIAASRAGSEHGLLSKPVATEMLTVQKAPFGLGPFLEGSGRAFHFSHEGEDEGFLSEVVYFPETGQGAAVMINGEGGWPLVHEILYAVAAQYSWPDFAPKELTPIPMDVASMEKVVGVYAAAYEVFPVVVDVRRDGDGLVFSAPGLGMDGKVVFTSPTSFALLDSGDSVSLVVDSTGHVQALKLGDFEIPRRPGS